MSLVPENLIPGILKPESSDEQSDMGNLSKASFIELFFDLVLIVCMRRIVPVLLSSSDTGITPYEYYSFAFSFVLLLQIWFSCTVLMNRSGRGDLKDTRFLVVHMFLLFIMTQAISADWRSFVAFNVSWILLNVNLSWNWRRRLHELNGEMSAADVRFIRRIIAVHLVQAGLVLFSFALSNVPAQVCCGVALLVGFLAWPLSTPLSDLSREHLFERCGLLLVLVFGEALVGVNSVAMEVRDGSAGSTATAILVTFIYFLITVGLFLMYVVQIQRRTDVSKIRSGSRYMALTAWLAFCLFNITAGFEMMIEGKTLGPVSSDVVLACWLVVYMLSFFLFTTFNRSDIRPSVGRQVKRAVCCLLPLACSAFFLVVDSLAANSVESEDVSLMVLTLLVMFMSLLIYALSVIFVVVLDYHTCVPWKKRQKKAKKNQAA